MSSTQPFLNLLQQIEAQANNSFAHSSKYVFNPARFYRTDEIGLSQLIAYLLNPNETHQQKNAFLNQFLRHQSLDDYVLEENDTAKVYTERYLHNSARRHDILIEAFRDNTLLWVIAIENKLRNAPDQEDQILDYLSDLAHISPKRYFQFYLSVNGEKPSCFSVSEEKWNEAEEGKHAKAISAKDICDWLKTLTPNDPKVAFFTTSLVYYFEEYIVQNTPKLPNGVYTSLKSDDSLLSQAIEFIENRQVIYQLLFEKTVQALKTLKENEPELSSYHIDYDVALGSKNNYITLKNENVEMSFVVESVKHCFAKAYFKVQLSEKHLPKDITKLALKNDQKYTPHSNYLWYYAEGYEEWQAEIWQQLRKEYFAQYLLDEFKQIHQFLKDNQDVLELA